MTLTLNVNAKSDKEEKDKKDKDKKDKVEVWTRFRTRIRANLTPFLIPAPRLLF
jgi:hypothetical protein